MLADHPIDPMILATDLDVATTKASWRVSDLAAEVANPRSRGIELEE